MKVFLSEDHRQHFPTGELYGGELVRPFECPERWDYVVAGLKEIGMTDFQPPASFDRKQAERVHDKDFVQFLETAWSLWQAEGFKGDALPTVIPARRMQQRVPDHIDGKLGYYAMAIETAITEGTWHAASTSAAIAQSAAKAIIDGEHAAFALCRPPGHHAALDLYGGYCFMNNAALAAQCFRDAGLQRVAILDVDFHHGNGTQDIFYDRSDVLFVSLHGDPKDAFPHFLGYADEEGVGEGHGYNVNYPLPPATDYASWKVALLDGLQKIQKFAPQQLVVSLGVDTFENDPISFFKLASDDYTDYGRLIAELGLPTLFVMEGGYAVEEIGINTANVLKGFVGG